MTSIKIQTTNILPKEVITKNENSGWFVTCLYSALIGGIISVFAHILSIIYTIAGVSNNNVLVGTLLTLLLLGAITTGLGWYDKLNKYGPAGGMLPTCGLSNAITNAAMQSKRDDDSFIKIVYKGFMSIAPILFWGWVACIIASVLIALTKI